MARTVIMKYTIHQGDNRDTLKTLEDNSVDAVITDPPYGIDFLGKAWDANTGALETYRECLRVLKPGGYILAFSAARTYHHLAVTLEQAGFEIRDQLMWLYASGFPKAQDIGKAIQKRQGVEETKEYKHNVPRNGGAGDTKHYENQGEIIPTSPQARQWEGWKTALKPAHEPSCMARKPFKGSTIDNVLQHGVGALNIDATRIPLEGNVRTSTTPNHIQTNSFETINTDEQNSFTWTGDPVGFVPNEAGRFPSNVIGEVAGYQKFFYCPKVSRKERHTGFDTPPDPLANYSQGDVKNHPLWDPSIGTNVQRLKHKIMENNKDLGIPTEQSMLDDMGGYYIDNQGNKQEISGKDIYLPDYGYIKVHSLKDYYAKWCETNNKIVNVGNNHPTVKPVALMRYLIKLVTPPNSTVLDPFTGSGSTGMAAVELGHEFIGCELDPNYVAIAQRRIEAWNTTEYENKFAELFENQGQ